MIVVPCTRPLSSELHIQAEAIIVVVGICLLGLAQI